MIPLTKLKNDIMREFYSIDPTKVIFNKTRRNLLWKLAVSKSDKIDLELLDRKCPALAHQIRRSYDTGRNIQSAVFSECVYAQTYANMLELNVFKNCFEDCSYLPNTISELLKSYNLTPRYIYSDSKGGRMLIQAGGCNGIDSALITVEDLNVYTVEFKEPGAKTSEPDLPKYKEDGNLCVTDSFLEKYPQFESMLNEHKDLNFFKLMGNNEHKFSDESVNIAVTNNYTKKYADVVCTEDMQGYLVMMPINQISQWAQIEGEIRPAGRNHYNVWTPEALCGFLKAKGACINGDRVSINIENLGIRIQRGGNGKISGYKINPLFFVYLKDCVKIGNIIDFDLRSVQQLNPTIAGKMFFKSLDYRKVKNYYSL